MIYREFETHADLAPYVQLVWMMESEHEDDHAPRSLIVPDGIVEIVFHYGDPWITTVAGGNRMVQPRSFAVSQMRKYIEIESNGRTGFVSVRFYPWGAYHFFDRPVDSLLDDTVSTAMLWPEHYDDLMEKIRAVASGMGGASSTGGASGTGGAGGTSGAGGSGLASVVQGFLLDRLKEHFKDDVALDESVKLIRSTGGQLSVEEVGERVGLSRKQLERKFVATVGTTPKTFARISRFLNICHHLDRYRDSTLTRLAHECGYFDQAHFIREFSVFTGFTPKAFFDKNNVKFAEL
ncbi:MAG: helix-turn-helix transcriptional regulator [Gemmatimonadetes bacterium]|nr:helix-turn-helix transcriptional regulator [Gemmatimonadota bacterium]MYG15025.1 helix-turn-helix transcriptional regulator [Gemmatimonadota bacterium]